MARDAVVPIEVPFWGAHEYSVEVRTQEGVIGPSAFPLSGTVGPIDLDLDEIAKSVRGWLP